MITIERGKLMGFVAKEADHIYVKRTQTEVWIQIDEIPGDKCLLEHKKASNKN